MRAPSGSRLVRGAAICALTFGLGAGASSWATTKEDDASRERELSRFLFEQARVYQKARGSALVPLSLDAYAPRVGLVDAKSLFERATKGPAAAPAPDTAERLFEESIVTTYRMLLNTPIACCLCTTAPTCNDGLFCNGGEVCSGGICGAGSTPCVDFDPCTTDLCLENTDTCSFAPLPPPAEVAQLDVKRLVPASPVATITWSSVGGASAYNVYRGDFANLGDLACFQSGVSGTSQNDDGAIPVRAFYMLVSSLGCGESGLGNGNPSPRPPPPGCP